MSNPKRVWDSKKRAVRQWKEQVWLVDWEKVVNTNHWFAEATWEDVVYGSSWEVAQEPLQTYGNWWSEDVPSGSSITINRELSQTSGEVGSQIRIYIQCDNAFTIWWSLDILQADSIIHESWEGYNVIAVCNVIGVWETTIVIQDNITWDSDSIEFTGTPAPSNVRINRELTSTLWKCGTQFIIYANVDNIESASLNYTSSNENIFIESGSIESWQEGYNLRIDVTCYNPAEWTVTITDNTTWYSDSISINFILLNVWAAPVYINRENSITYEYNTAQWVLWDVEAWVEDDSIIRIVRIDKPNPDNGYWYVLLEWLTEGTTILHVRPQNYMEEQAMASLTVTPYVAVSEISNLSTTTATVFDYDYRFASFNYTPTNSSNPPDNISIYFKEGSTDDFGLYLDSYNNWVINLSESNGQNLETWVQSTYQIINDNDQSNILEITLIKGKNIDEITLDSSQATTTVWADTTVSFTYTPTDWDTNCLYVEWDGTSYGSVSISWTNWSGTITITWVNVWEWTFNIYRKGNSTSLGIITVTVTAAE